jgi:hypothetical protein
MKTVEPSAKTTMEVLETLKFHQRESNLHIVAVAKVVLY